MDLIIDLLPILIPFVVIEIAIRVYCIIDMRKPERKLAMLSLQVWTIVVALVTFAWVVYLLVGKEE